MALNIKDFPAIENEFKAAGKDAAKIQRAVEKYTGPDNGTEYDDKTGKLQSFLAGMPMPMVLS